MISEDAWTPTFIMAKDSKDTLYQMWVRETPQDSREWRRVEVMPLEQALKELGGKVRRYWSRDEV